MKNKKLPLVIFIVAIFTFGNIKRGDTQAVTTTSQSTETVTLKDSDGDGILDKDDPHPDTPEIYIVKDDNRNGIVDNFEK